MYDDAVGILRAYRESREASRRNTKPSKWFVSFAGDGLSGMIDAFKAGDENARLLAANKQTMPNAEYQSLGLKIAFLAGCRRDLRAQFAVGEAQWRLPGDADRHAAVEASEAIRALDEAEFVLEQMEGG